MKRRKLKNVEKFCGNVRTFKTIYKLCKLLELYKASHMLATVAKSNLEVKVNKSSHPKLCMSQSLSQTLKYVRSYSQL